MACPSLKATVLPRTELDRGGVRHLNQIQLSRRWSISPRTLERWRWLDQGPNYVKIGGRVVYRLEDIEAYEGARIKRAADPKRAAS
jgi:hypothetical protein